MILSTPLISATPVVVNGFLMVEFMWNASTAPDGTKAWNYHAWRSDPSGTIKNLGNFDPTFFPPGTVNRDNSVQGGTAYTYYVQAVDEFGSLSGISSATVMTPGTPGPHPPVINYFTATPPIIQAGQTSQLTYSVTGALNVAIFGGPGTWMGSYFNAYPSVTTVYTLTATAIDGSTATATVTVTVGQLPPPPPSGPQTVWRSQGSNILRDGVLTTSKSDAGPGAVDSGLKSN